MSKNWSYKITDSTNPHCGRTLWSGRYCAVTGVVNYVDYNTGKTWFLITKRGTGAADFKGKWCLPCGFLEADENGESGVSREIFEETGIKVNYKPLFWNVETEPIYCNNGNVTLRYVCNMESMPIPCYKTINGEYNEVEEVKWISEDDIDNYDWCFNHNDILYMFLCEFTIHDCPIYKEKIQHRIDYLNKNN